MTIDLASAMAAPRLRLLGLLALAVLVGATLTRAGLTIVAAAPADFGLVELPAIFACGLLYDLAFTAYLLAPATLWLLLPERLWRTRASRTLVRFGVIALVYLLAFVAQAEFVFFDEFQTRFNFIAVDYLVYTSEVLDNIWESYGVAWLLAADAAVAGIVYWFLRPPLQRLLATPGSARPGAALACWLVIAACAVALGQEPRAAFTNPFAAEIASNGPYQFFAAFRNNELDYDRFYATLPLAQVDQELRDALYTPNTRFESQAPLDLRRRIDNPGTPRHLNIVLIMVESLGADFIGYYGDTRKFTPHLDELARHSVSFDNFYAAGTRTVRGLEAVTLSVPPTPGRAIVKRIGREGGLWSLGAVLNQAGYHSSFVYGGHAYFDNMGAFFTGNGYDVVDQSSTPADDILFTNAWGMSDEDLYRQALRVARGERAAGRPFFLHIMTTSNPRPDTYPEGRIPGAQGGRGMAVRYTDWAIHDFLEQARHEPWFDETLFVILGDHCANSAGKIALPAARYHIPLLIYAPAVLQPARITTLAGQMDLAPTLLGLLNLDYESAFLGRDVFAPGGTERAVISNYQYLGLLENDLVTVLGPRRTISRHGADNRMLSRAGPQLTLDDPLVRDAVALYQGASYMYGHHLNAWPPSTPGVTPDADGRRPSL